MPTPSLISTSDLAERLGDPAVKIVDASWYLPTEDRDGFKEYLEIHIPGAVFFDIDAIADQSTDLPHMLPTASEFEEAVSAMGISPEDQIVVYDAKGLFSAARVWWTFHVFGHENVSVLDGGLPKWRAENRPVESGEVEPEPSQYFATFDPSAVVSFEEAKRALEIGAAEFIDARPADRFLGRAAEPRPGVRPGRAPGSLSVPAGSLIEDGRLKDPAALKAAFEQAGLKDGRPVITSCGSGVTAAILCLALDVVGGHEAVALYDGAWAEWGAREDAPVVSGDADG